MALNILPEKIVKTSSYSNGSSISEVYTLDAWSNLYIISLLITLIAIGVSIPFVTLILVFLYTFKLDEFDYTSCTLAIIISGYLLFDNMMDWIVTDYVNFFYAKDNYPRVLSLNFAVLVTSIFNIFFGSIILELTRYKILLFIINVLLLYTAYEYSNNFIYITK